MRVIRTTSLFPSLALLLACGSSTSAPEAQDTGAGMGGTAATAAANAASSNGSDTSSVDTSVSSAAQGSVTSATESAGSTASTTGAQTSSGGASASGGSGDSSNGGAVSSDGQGGSAGDAGGATSTDGGRPTCQNDADCGGFKCCEGYCVNLDNDILNCGACGNLCAGESPYCGSGSCTTAPCFGDECGGERCCGNQCCGAGELCCVVNQGPSILGCFEPEFGTCPMGCGACACASPETPIATPEGERPIAELGVGDLVYSVDHDQVRAVPIVRINRVPVRQHSVVHVGFSDGSSFEMTGAHPTADGRRIADLRVGDRLDNRAVTELYSITYRHAYTYDILPASSTGAYFASGVLMGSTLVQHAMTSAFLAAPWRRGQLESGEAAHLHPLAEGGLYCGTRNRLGVTSLLGSKQLERSSERVAK